MRKLIVAATAALTMTMLGGTSYAQDTLKIGISIRCPAAAPASAKVA